MTVGPRLLGKVALITGGASGIGAATATVFAEHGASVVVTDVNDNLGHAVVDKIREAGGEAVYLRLDTTDEAQWIDVVAETVAKFGRLDVLANIAGIADRQADNKHILKIEDASVDNWNKVFAVNSTGVFLGVKHAIAPMRAAGGGSIINISSIYGIVGSHAGSAYHSSKGAVRTFTKSAAIQCADDRIRVNSVHPGFVDTPLTANTHADPELMAPRLNATPLGRFGTAEDIAMGCLFLASDESAWMTGSELVIDGGMLAQ